MQQPGLLVFFSSFLQAYAPTTDSTSIPTAVAVAAPVAAASLAPVAAPVVAEAVAPAPAPADDLVLTSTVTLVRYRTQFTSTSVVSNATPAVTPAAELTGAAASAFSPSAPVPGTTTLSTVSAAAVPDSSASNQNGANLGAFSTQIIAVLTQAPVVSAQSVFNQMAGNLWDNFWSQSTNTFTDKCDNSTSPVLWDLSVAAMAVVNTGNQANTAQVLNAIGTHKCNQIGGYSATNAGDSDIYNDDDAQALWVLIDGAQLTGSSAANATALLNYLQTQQNGAVGGVSWDYNGQYVALISTLEVALAAAKLYKVDNNPAYLTFSKYCINWVLDNLVDPKDNFIYDGMGTDGSINKGKLTYTIGVAMSTLAYLSLWDNTNDWQNIAITFGVKALGAGNLNSQFFSNGYINDSVDHSHNFFTGLADLLVLTSPSSSYQSSAYALFKSELIRETRHLYDEYSPVINSNSCSSVGAFNTLLNYGSLTQIFYQASRVAGQI